MQHIFSGGRLLSSKLLSRLFVATIVSSLMALPVASIEVESLYTAEIVLDPQDPDARDNAYRQALAEVLVRVTGSADIADPARMADIFPNPARYVTQYRPGPDNTLIVSLDGPAIETMLRQTGNTVWGSERPLTLVWLAVDWGDGEREVVAADDPERFAGAARSIDRNRLLRERVQAVATSRGVPVVFPLMDVEDRQNVGFADIWGGFDERLLLASQRYGTSSILVGRIRPDAVTPHRWTLYLGNERQDWLGEPETAANLLADTLAAEFAFAGNAPAETVILTVSGISSVNAYGEMQNLLTGLGQIDGFKIDEVSGSQVRYQVRVRGDVERLRRALELSGMLQADERISYGTNANGATGANSLEFVFHPKRISSIEYE